MKAILTYHSVDDSGSVISVTSAQLERHLDTLLAKGVKVVPLTALPLAPADADAVAITFDDGFTNFAISAVPLLESRNLTATVFVVPSYVGTRNDWEATDSRFPVPRLRLMSWDEIRGASAKGFDIGGHGMTHRSLRGLSAAALEAEVDGCLASIESGIGRRPASFAFPYGDCDQAAVEAAAVRFDVACTTRLGLVREGDSQHELPRLDMFYFRNGRMLDHWGTPVFRTYVALRRAARAAGRVARSRRGTAGIA